MPELARASVLIVGLGGLGCPVAQILARAGVGRLLLLDDDVVDESNLHRQILYRDEDVRRDKLEVAVSRLRELAPAIQIEGRATRLLPENARELVRSVDLVVEGADNYATKFLVADAARLEERAVIHGAALGWRATAWAVAPRGRPCYRCLFEDLPEGEALNCSSAGVMGPVVGFAGALLAELALGVLSEAPEFGVLSSYDGLTDQLRRVPIAARASCALCGERRRISDVEEARYTQRNCAA